VVVEIDVLYLADLAIGRLDVRANQLAQSISGHAG
jgi:hypothetical protein